MTVLTRIIRTILLVAVALTTGCGLTPQAFESAATTDTTDGYVSYAQLASDPFGWEDFDVIPRDTWGAALTTWNSQTEDEMLNTCNLVYSYGDDDGQRMFRTTAMASGLTDDEAWALYAVTITGCEELSYW